MLTQPFLHLSLPPSRSLSRIPPKISLSSIYRYVYGLIRRGDSFGAIQVCAESRHSWLAACLCGKAWAGNKFIGWGKMIYFCYSLDSSPSHRHMHLLFSHPSIIFPLNFFLPTLDNGPNEIEDGVDLDTSSSTGNHSRDLYRALAFKLSRKTDASISAHERALWGILAGTSKETQNLTVSPLWEDWLWSHWEVMMESRLNKVKQNILLYQFYTSQSSCHDL